MSSCNESLTSCVCHRPVLGIRTSQPCHTYVAYLPPVLYDLLTRTPLVAHMHTMSDNSTVTLGVRKAFATCLSFGSCIMCVKVCLQAQRVSRRNGHARYLQGVVLMNKVSKVAVEAATTLDGHFVELMDGRGWATPPTAQRSNPSGNSHHRWATIPATRSSNPSDSSHQMWATPPATQYLVFLLRFSSWVGHTARRTALQSLR